MSRRLARCPLQRTLSLGLGPPYPVIVLIQRARLHLCKFTQSRLPRNALETIESAPRAEHDNLNLVPLHWEWFTPYPHVKGSPRLAEWGPEIRDSQA